MAKRMTIEQYQEMTGHRHKYHNQPVVDEEGIRYDSKKEYARWRELKLLEKAGEISHLERQKKYVLQPGFRFDDGSWVRPITYIADHVFYDETEDRRHSQDMRTRWVVEDVKSPITRQNGGYRNKYKQMMYVHHIKVKELI